jgi:hypothetical protein
LSSLCDIPSSHVQGRSTSGMMVLCSTIRQRRSENFFIASYCAEKWDKIKVIFHWSILKSRGSKLFDLVHLTAPSQRTNSEAHTLCTVLHCFFKLESSALENTWQRGEPAQWMETLGVWGWEHSDCLSPTVGSTSSVQVHEDSSGSEG